LNYDALGMEALSADIWGLGKTHWWLKRKQPLLYQRRFCLASSRGSRGSIYTSCSLFPAFTITAQKHDASLLVPSICRPRKAHCRPHLQGLARHWSGAFQRARAKGPRGLGAGRRTQSLCRSFKPSAQYLVNFSRRAGLDRLLQQQHFAIISATLRPSHSTPDNDFMKRLPPIPRSAKPPPGPLACWRRLTPFGTLAGQTRGRLPLRVSLGTASDGPHGTRHFTQCLLATATRLSPFPIPSTDPNANTFDLQPLPAVGRRSDSPRCRSSADRSPPPRNLYGPRIFGPQAAEE
jgi:hypothetical protein